MSKFRRFAPIEVRFVPKTGKKFTIFVFGRGENFRFLAKIFTLAAG